MQTEISIPKPAQNVGIAKSLPRAQRDYLLLTRLDIYYRKRLTERVDFETNHRGNFSILPAMTLAKFVFWNYETEDPERVYGESKVMAWKRGGITLPCTFNGNIYSGRPAKFMRFILKFSKHCGLWSALP